MEHEEDGVMNLEVGKLVGLKKVFPEVVNFPKGFQYGIFLNHDYLHGTLPEDYNLQVLIGDQVFLMREIDLKEEG